MSLSWKDLLILWVPWPQIILILVGLGVLYGLGWYRLRQRDARRVASGWRLASFLGGLLALAVAMLSAIEVLQDLLFSIHMTQHLLIMMVGAPLLLLANPYPFLIWGLPLNARRGVSLLMAPQARFRKALRRLATPWISWGLFVGATWLWHTPAAYDAALRYEVLHVLEHLAYFATAGLFWWQVSGAAPRLSGRLGYGFRMGYVLSALVPNEILGVAIAFSQTALYSYYTTVPRLWGLSVMDDQALGGAIMWVPGGMMYVITAVALLARALHVQDMRTRTEGIMQQ